MSACILNNGNYVIKSIDRAVSKKPQQKCVLCDCLFVCVLCKDEQSCDFDIFMR